MDDIDPSVLWILFKLVTPSRTTSGGNRCHSTFSEVHRDQYVYSTARVQGNQSINTIVHGNQIFQSSFGLENLYRAHVPSAAFDSGDRHPAPNCLPGTRLEPLAHLTDWVDNPSCDQPICWLNGPAGSGKSAIAQTIAEKYASLHRLAASFFFSRKEISRRKARGLFPTLACQMLVFAPSIRQALFNALDTDVTIPTKVLTEQARKLLQEPIVSSTCPFREPALIVVDSLDECDDIKMAKEIINLLAETLRRSRWPLRVLITSRAELHIVQTFQESELQGLVYSLRIQDFDVDGDIRAYLRYSFSSLQESMNAISTATYPVPWPSDDELEMIVQKAAGLFIFATTVIKYVGMDYGSPITRLQAVLQAFRNSASAESAVVHSPLDMLYSDALCAIPDLEKVRLVLGMVVFSFQPLSTRGLDDLIWTYQFDASYFVKNFSSVLTVSDSNVEGDGVIRFYHTSFRDFLTTPNRSGQYFVDPTNFHGILARACLELMIRHLKGDVLNLGDPSIINCEIEDLDKQCKFHIKEGVRYACRWFAHHVSQVQCDQVVDNALLLCVQGFARRCLLNWIEVLSLTGALDSAIFSLREMVEWLKRSAKPHDETLSLFLDAERLVLMCYDSINRSALQVYYSLPCLPTCVQIRKIYAHELKDKFVIMHGLDDHWQLCLRSVSTNTSIKSLSISASGRLIATAGDTPGVQLWDALTGTNTGHFYGDGVSSCSVMFSQSGDYVAIGYDTGAMDIWDVTTGQRLLDPTQSPHNASVTTLAFPQNSPFVASGAADATVHIWDISTKTLKHSLAYHKGPVRCLLFSPNDEVVASGSDDQSVVTCDVHSGRLLRTFQGHTSRVNSISFSPESGNIVSGSDDQSVRFWDTRTGVCLRTFTGMHKKPIRHVWITADNKYVVSVCNMNIYLWETNYLNRKPPQHLWSVNRYYRKLATIFPAWYAKIARLFPADLFGRMAELDDGTPLCTAPSLHGTSIACAYGTSLLLLEYSPPQSSWSKVRRPLASSSTLDDPPLFAEDSGDSFTAVVMTLDMTALVTSSENGTIKIWNTSPRNNWKDIQGGFKRTIDGFWPTPDGRHLLVKQLIGLQLVASTGAFIKDLETGGDTLGTVGAVPSPDSRYFAFWQEYTWNVDKSFSIYIYDASTGARIKRIPGFFDITTGRFSAESDLFACAHGKGIVQIWELPSTLCKTTIDTGYAAITALEFVPGNITLVVGSNTGCVEIRLVETGEVMHHVECASSKVLALAVPIGALLVIVGHEDGSLFVWDPSYTSIAPHRLSSETSSVKQTLDVTSDGVDYIKFTEGYRSISTRSTKGVICTWNLTHCLAEYAAGEPAKATSVDSQSASLGDSSTLPDDSPTPPSNLSSADLSDQCTLAGEPTLESASPDETDESFKLGESIDTTTDPETPETPESTPSPVSTSGALSCPHLVSRSDEHIVYDRYFRSTYAIDGREGWVYHGSRRMFWLPDDLRPASPIALSAVEDTLVILTKSRPIVFIDMRPMTKGRLSN